MPKLSRRAFLKLAAPWPALPIFINHQRSLENVLGRSGRSNAPNVLVVVFDTLSAANMSLYGYPRNTTPQLARIAERSTVFHNHYAAGNFTSPGTASLLTGTYPWSHRAFNFNAKVAEGYEDKNLFRAFSDSAYHRMAYTHNPLADFFLYQFRDAIDVYLNRETFYLARNPSYFGIPIGDQDIGFRSRTFLASEGGRQVRPGSLFLSLLVELGYEQYNELTLAKTWQDRFPEGLPAYHGDRSPFLLEQAIDGIQALVRNAPQPFLAYFHLLPPHDPYNPRREFIDLFQDGWTPVAKEPHFFTRDRSEDFLRQKRKKYDEYIAYVDAEFGRLYDQLARSGLLDNTYLVFTSDHGELFERGIWGHGVPVLYEPLIRVPLIILKPKQAQREDVHTPTSCVDLLPTLLHATEQPIPEWCEGQVLPTFAEGVTDGERTIFAIEAMQNPQDAALAKATLALMKGRYKLLQYLGYPGYARQSELYDAVSDPEELNDLSTSRPALAADLKAELAAKLRIVNQPYLQ